MIEVGDIIVITREWLRNASLYGEALSASLMPGMTFICTAQITLDDGTTYVHLTGCGKTIRWFRNDSEIFKGTSIVKSCNTRKNRMI